MDMSFTSGAYAEGFVVDISFGWLVLPVKGLLNQNCGKIHFRKSHVA